MQTVELLPDTIGDRPFFRAGIHEKKIFLTIVIEPEMSGRFAVTVGAGPVGVDRRRFSEGHPRVVGDGVRGARLVCIEEFLDPGDGAGRDALAVAQAADEFSVVDGAAAERGFGDLHPSAIGFDAGDKVVMLGHWNFPAVFLSSIYPNFLFVSNSGKLPIGGRRRKCCSIIATGLRKPAKLF